MIRLSVAIIALGCAALAQAEKAPPAAVLTAHQSAVIAVTFAPDGKALASASDDGTVRVWDVATRQERFVVRDTLNKSNPVRFTPDGQALVTLTTNRTVRLVDAERGRTVRTLALPDLVGGPQGFDVAPDGKSLAVVGRSTLLLFNVADGQQTAAYEVHKGYGVCAVAWSPDGKRLATTGSEKTAALVDAASGRIVKTWPLGVNGGSLAFAPDGKTVFAGSEDRKLFACKLDDDQPELLMDGGVPVLTLSRSADGKTLVVGGPGHAPWLMTFADRKVAAAPLDADDWVKSAAQSPDGAWLAGGANGGAVYLWKAPR